MEMHTRSANAERVHRTYVRRRSGTRVFSIEADEVALAEKLIEARLLDPVLADDCAAIEKAATQLIKTILSE
jgi:hypothetical protein